MTARGVVIAIAVLWLLLTGAGWADLNEAGKAAYARGDFTEAERLFREASAIAPREPLPHYHRGVALTRLQRLTEAAAAYRQALQLDPPASIAAAAQAGLREVERVTARVPRRDEDSTPPPPNRPRPSRASLPSDSVRLQRIRGNWYVEVVVNDQHRATFLVDTGATACVITPALAEALGLQPDSDAPTVRVRGVTGSAAAQVVVIPSLRVGDAEAEKVHAFIMPLAGMQGILGNTFLARFTATLDPAQGILTLTPR